MTPSPLLLLPRLVVLRRPPGGLLGNLVDGGRRRCSSSRHSRGLASSYASALRRKAIQHGAPPSIRTVLDDFELLKDDDRPPQEWMKTAPTIRQVGSTRRVHLPSPYLTPDQLEGLAYRIKALTKNDALSSILVANNTDSQSTLEKPKNDNDDEHFDPLAFCLPTTMLDRDDMTMRNEHYDPGFPPEPGYTYHVSSLYDPTCPNTLIPHDLEASIQSVLTHVSSLTLALRGDAKLTKIPTIVMPHGMLQDAGFAFLQANYVLATRETSFQFTNPRKGLSCDPVGLSLILPRLGQEFHQPSQKYPCGMLVALFGYQATADDCLETGLATHYVDKPSLLGGLEHALSELPPWRQQTIVKPKPHYYGRDPSTIDLNAEFRNYVVAETLRCFSDYHASGTDVWIHNDQLDFSDPSFDTDEVPWQTHRSSDLVDIAAALADIFNEPTLVGLHDRLQEVAHRPLSTTTTNDSDDNDNEGIVLAQELVRRLQLASPLALHVTHRLMQLGGRKSETWTSCLAREHRVQAKLLQGRDFRNWMASSKAGGTNAPPKWKHASLEDVSQEEVLDVVEE